MKCKAFDVDEGYVTILLEEKENKVLIAISCSPLDYTQITSYPATAKGNILEEYHSYDQVKANTFYAIAKKRVYNLK